MWGGMNQGIYGDTNQQGTWGNTNPGTFFQTPFGTQTMRVQVNGRDVDVNNLGINEAINLFSRSFGGGYEQHGLGSTPTIAVYAV